MKHPLKRTRKASRRRTINGFTEEQEVEILRRMKAPTIPIDDIHAFIESCKD